MKKVFLGGTCAESKWREALIELLKIDYFNPVVEDWTEECIAEERKQRKECDYCLYTLTPRMKGTYSIAEVIDDSNKKPQRTILCILSNDINPNGKGLIEWSKEQKKSLEQVGKMVERNGGKYFTNLIDVADYLNSSENEYTTIRVLKDTVEMMHSEDYKERFRAEYFQLVIRMKGLANMLGQYKEGTLNFKPSCSYDLLNGQLKAMKLYKDYLEECAEIEDIILCN